MLVTQEPVESVVSEKGRDTERYLYNIGQVYLGDILPGCLVSHKDMFFIEQLRHSTNAELLS